MDDSVLAEIKKKAPRWIWTWGSILVLALAYALTTHQTSCEVHSVPPGAAGPPAGRPPPASPACGPPQILIELVDGSDSIAAPDRALQDALDEIESALARPSSTAAFVRIIGGLSDSSVNVGPFVRLCGEGEAVAVHGFSGAEIRSRVASRFRLLRGTRAFTRRTYLLEAFLSIPELSREGRERLHSQGPGDVQVVVRSDFVPRPARSDLYPRVAELPLAGIFVTALVLPGRDRHSVAVEKIGYALRAAGARFSRRDPF